MGHYRNNLRHHRTNLRHNTSQYPRHQSALANPDPTYARRHRSNSPDRCNRCSLCSHKTENDQTCRQVASDHLEESHCAKKAIYSVRFMCSRSPAPVCSSPYDGGGAYTVRSSSLMPPTFRRKSYFIRQKIYID